MFNSRPINARVATVAAKHGQAWTGRRAICIGCGDAFRNFKMTWQTIRKVAVELRGWRAGGGLFWDKIADISLNHGPQQRALQETDQTVYSATVSSIYRQGMSSPAAAMGTDSKGDKTQTVHATLTPGCLSDGREQHKYRKLLLLDILSRPV